MTTTITPCLWFDGQAEEAAQFYTSIFKNGKITHVQRYTDVGSEMHKHEAGTVMAVAFELNGQPFSALNGGPQFTFSPAISFQVNCADQAEVDHYWDKLREGGDPKKQHCGWLADKYGVSWQIVPKALYGMISSEDEEKGKSAYKAMLGMKKMDVQGLERAFEGGSAGAADGEKEG